MIKNTVLGLVEKVRRNVPSYRNDTKGAVAVEFALIAVAFLALIFGTLEVGRLIFTWNAVQYTIEQAARTALVTDDVTEAEILQFIEDEMPASMVNLDDLAVTVTYTTVSDVNFVELQGVYNYQTITPFLPDSWLNIQLPATSRIVLP